MGNLNTFYLLERSYFALADTNEQADFISKMDSQQTDRVNSLKTRMKVY